MKKASACTIYERRSGGNDMLDFLAIAAIIGLIIRTAKSKKHKPDMIPGWERRSHEARGISETGRKDIQTARLRHE